MRVRTSGSNLLIFTAYYARGYLFNIASGFSWPSASIPSDVFLHFSCSHFRSVYLPLTFDSSDVAMTLQSFPSRYLISPVYSPLQTITNVAAEFQSHKRSLSPNRRKRKELNNAPRFVVRIRCNVWNTESLLPGIHAYLPTLQMYYVCPPDASAIASYFRRVSLDLFLISPCQAPECRK